MTLWGKQFAKRMSGAIEMFRPGHSTPGNIIGGCDSKKKGGVCRKVFMAALFIKAKSPEPAPSGSEEFVP